MAKAVEKAKSKLGVNISGTDNTHTVSIDYSGALTSLFGTDSPEMATNLLHHCLTVLTPSEARDGSLGKDQRKFMLEAISGIAPRDGIESMLAVQMASTHVAMIRAGGSLARAENLPQYEAYDRSYNKLARTYTAQMEALRKHRSGGKQTVVVQHVNVEDGGQAIVGNVATGGGRAMAKHDDNPMYAANAAPRCTAKSKRTGERCKGPAVTGWSVCRMHGAGGGHPAGKAHPAWRHGMRSKEWIDERKYFNDLIRETREIERLIR